MAKCVQVGVWSSVCGWVCDQVYAGGCVAKCVRVCVTKCVQMGV